MPLRQRPKSVKLSKKTRKRRGAFTCKVNYFFLPKLNGSYHVLKVQCAISTNLRFIPTTFTSLQVVISNAVFWWWHPRLFNQRKCIKLVLSRWLSPITFLNRSSHSRLRNNKSIFWHLCFSPELACLLLLSVRPKPKLRPKLRSISAESVRPKLRPRLPNRRITKKTSFLRIFAPFSHFLSNFQPNWNVSNLKINYEFAY